MPPKPTLYAATVATPGTAAQPVAAASECKPKKTLSEETKAKLAASRQRKKEEKEAAAAEEARLVKEEFDRLEAEQQAAAQKKEAAAAKRREARLKRKENTTPTTSAAEATPETSPEPTPVKGRKRQKSVEADKPASAPAEPPAAAGNATASKHSIEGDTPPAWFTKYVTDMMKEKREQEGTKVTKKEVKEEGMKTAAEKWQDKYTRARVRDAVDGHMGQMYSMIFA